MFICPVVAAHCAKLTREVLSFLLSHIAHLGHRESLLTAQRGDLADTGDMLSLGSPKAALEAPLKKSETTPSLASCPLRYYVYLESAPLRFGFLLRGRYL